MRGGSLGHLDSSAVLRNNSDPTRMKSQAQQVPGLQEDELTSSRWRSSGAAVSVQLTMLSARRTKKGG